MLPSVGHLTLSTLWCPVSPMPAQKFLQRCKFCHPAGVSVKQRGVVNALTLVITLQASGNLVNSYIDYNYGVDTVETAGDR